MHIPDHEDLLTKPPHDALGPWLITLLRLGILTAAWLGGGVALLSLLRLWR